MYRKWCVFCKILNPGTRMLFSCCCANSNKSWKEVSIVSRADKHWRSNKKSTILASTKRHSCPCVNFLLLSSVLFLELSNFSKSLLHHDLHHLATWPIAHHYMWRICGALSKYTFSEKLNSICKWLPASDKRLVTMPLVIVAAVHYSPKQRKVSL